MSRRPFYISVAVVALVTLVVLNLPSRTTARLKLALGSVFLPLFGASSGAQQVAAKSGDLLLPKSELLRVNEVLRQQNQQLRLQATQAAEQTRENDRLRQMLGWQKQAAWKVKAANVISRDPANWWRTIQIDLGSRDGLKENLPVLTPEGFLVGRISAVSLTRAQVVLIGDVNCKVPATVENESRDKGVITSSGPFDGSFVNLTYLPSTATVKPGQRIVSSDFSAIYPKGIPIGVVADSKLSDTGLFLEAEIKLAARLSSLEEVWVILP